jgi:hypothetical protein
MMISNSMGGQSAEAGLAAAPVVGTLDPGDDLDPEFVAGGPAAPVQDVALQQREERFHGGVVAGGTDLAHGADHAMPGECPVHLPGAELAAPVRMQDAAGDVAASAGDGHLDGRDHEPGLHALVDGPPDDPVREHVLDGTDADLALVGLVLGDVREPQPVRRRGGEVAAHEVVVRRGAGRGSLASLGSTEPRPPAVVAADPPHHPVRHPGVLLGAADLIGEEPVPELGVVEVRVVDRAREVRLGELTVGDRRLEPPVVGLAGETEYPTHHHDGDPVIGQVAHERVHHPFGRFACPR